MICALILLTPNFCDQLRWNSHGSPRLMLMEDFIGVVLCTYLKGRMGKPHWRREEVLEGAPALIREQVEPVRRGRSSGAGQISLIWEWKVLSHSQRQWQSKQDKKCSPSSDPGWLWPLRCLTTCESTLTPGPPSALGIICFTPVTEEGWTVTRDTTAPDRESNR